MGPRFGLVYQGTDYDPGDFAELAEGLGFDSVWVGEHISNWRPAVTAIPVLGMFASRTRRILIGSAVILLPLRQPVVIAKELATLDQFCKGRLVVGVGAGGENAAEFDACGVPVAERFGRLNEMLQILPRLWREDGVVFQGQYFTLDGVSIDPKPARPGGPRVLVAGRKEGAMRRAVRYGHGFMPYLFSPEQFAKAMDQIEALAGEQGRDLSTFENALFQFIVVAQTREKGRRLAAEGVSNLYQQDFTKLVDRFCVFGTPQDCVARLREYVQAGVEHFLLTQVSGDLMSAPQVEVLAREVVGEMR